LINPLKESNVAYDIVRYKYSKMSPIELISSLKIIVTFEEMISKSIVEDNFESLSEK
jgi:hypothetical protein